MIGVIGAGTMGTGIAQVASTFGHKVILYDAYPDQLDSSKESLEKILKRQVEKERMTQDEIDGILERITFTDDLDSVSPCRFVIEAIVEDLEVKKKVFKDIEERVGDEAVLASNTSSLSIASISAALEHPQRFLGVHFFNPAPLMKLVEIIPGISTADDITDSARDLIDSWEKVTVIAKDTPGFIVQPCGSAFLRRSPPYL